MLLVFPITRHLAEKSLEGMSIIVCVRWMLFVPMTFGVALLIHILFVLLDPELKANALVGQSFLQFFLVLYLTLLVRDVWLVRRTAVSWEESRIRSLEIMKRLPMVLLFLVPVFFLLESPQSAGPVIEWISGMLWVFSCLSVLFYLVYFTLLLSLIRLPRPSAIVGFILVLLASWNGAKQRIRTDKASFLTPDPPRVQFVLRIQPSTSKLDSSFTQA